MKVITLLNEKGGVGKTTLATHIAAGLAVKGFRVIMIDADPQANATIAFGLQPEPAIYDLVVRKAAFRDVLRIVSPEVYEIPGEQPRGLLAVVPSNIETRNIANSIADALAIRRRLDEIKTSVDFVVFDTSPTPSLLHGSIFLATDAVLYPTTLEYFSFTGLVNSLGHMQTFRQEKRNMNLGDIVPLGIVPMMFRTQTVGHSENLTVLRDKYGDLVWEPVRQRIVWSDATLAYRPVWNFEPGGSASREAMNIVNRVLHEVAHVPQA